VAFLWFLYTSFKEFFFTPFGHFSSIQRTLCFWLTWGYFALPPPPNLRWPSLSSPPCFFFLGIAGSVFVFLTLERFSTFLFDFFFSTPFRPRPLGRPHLFYFFPWSGPAVRPFHLKPFPRFCSLSAFSEWFFSPSSLFFVVAMDLPRNFWFFPFPERLRAVDGGAPPPFTVNRRFFFDAVNFCPSCTGFDFHRFFPLLFVLYRFSFAFSTLSSVGFSCTPVFFAIGDPPLFFLQGQWFSSSFTSCFCNQPFFSPTHQSFFGPLQEESFIGGCFFFLTLPHPFLDRRSQSALTFFC